MYDSYQDLGKDYLEHYGVLGMKWGIRRTPEQLGHKTSKSSIRKSSNLKKAGAKLKTYKKLAANYQDKAVVTALKTRALRFAEGMDWVADDSASAEYFRASHYEFEAQKYAKEHQNLFEKTKVDSVDQELVDLGKKYIKQYERVEGDTLNELRRVGLDHGTSGNVEQVTKAMRQYSQKSTTSKNDARILQECAKHLDKYKQVYNDPDLYQKSGSPQLKQLRTELATTLKELSPEMYKELMELYD